MDEQEKDTNELLEKRKKKIKSWLKDPYNLTLIIIIASAFLIRFYYFWMTKSQPLWWDEAEYMSMAKSFAGIVNFPSSSLRLPGFPLFASLFFDIGIRNEIVLRFFLAFLPSLIVIVLTYYLVKEMYPDKKIALISTAIIAVLWENLFYSNRFHTENISLIFLFLAFIILFKCYIKKENLGFIKPKYSLIWIILFSALGTFFRVENLPVLVTLFFMPILLNLSTAFEKKYRKYSLAGLAVILVLGVILLMNLSKIPFIAAFSNTKIPISWNYLNVFSGFYESYVSWLPNILFYAFLLGFVIALVNVLIRYDKLFKLKRNSEDLNFKSEVFCLLMIISVMAVFIIFIRSTAYEFRWFFMLLPGMLSLTAKGIIDFSEFVTKFSSKKILAIFLIVIITILGCYNQLVHADMIIKNKLTSYQQVKDSGLWLKENSNEGDVIISASLTQHTYYTERKVEDFYYKNSNENESGFLEKIQKLKPKYLVVSIFEPGFTPKWAYDWPQRHNDTVVPVQGYYMDPQQKQLALVIYRFQNF